MSRSTERCCAGSSLGTSLFLARRIRLGCSEIRRAAAFQNTVSSSFLDHQVEKDLLWLIDNVLFLRHPSQLFIK